MRRVPLPRVPDDDLEIRILRAPPQLALRAVTGCIEYRRISGPARRRLPGRRKADHPADRVDHRADRMRRAGPDVERARGRAPLEGYEGADVGGRQIADMDVIAQACAVGGPVA